MNKYEIMFIVKADVSEEDEKNTVKAFEKVLTDMGLDVNVRGETLNLAQFAELADRLGEL